MEPTHPHPVCARADTRSRLRAVLNPGRTLGRLVRYGAVSAVTTGLSLTVLSILLTLTPMPASVANLVAQAAGIPLSFALNRRWVWRRSGRASASRESGPFWAMSVAGLTLSTLATGLAGDLAAGLPHGERTVVVAAASLAAYGVLWLAEFVLLDRVVFARRRVDVAQADVGGPQPDRPHTGQTRSVTQIRTEAQFM